MTGYRYPWPASALTPEDMAALHAVRENGPTRTPITDLIAHAVRIVYGQRIVIEPTPSPTPKEIAA